MMDTTILSSALSCPHCVHVEAESMPTDARPFRNTAARVVVAKCVSRLTHKRRPMRQQVNALLPKLGPVS